ncbi:hypothetical protein NQ317_007885 [Molorchus minor]|uniref:C2H2-type domain-containing protein n=1 Tax=Molorchus minor TaxID=1323400 RepID=A0ABQ9JV01_9CUCU|nr:hypothetical protein NQ317_007885 [Molorchus minor]
MYSKYYFTMDTESANRIDKDCRRTGNGNLMFATHVMDSVTCVSCVETLANYIKFAITCEDTEKKINFYCKIQRNKAVIKLSNVLTFLGEEIWNNHGNIKKEGTLDNLEYSFEGHDVKDEIELYQTRQKHHLTRHLLGHKDISEVQMFKCEMCQFQTKHRDHLNRHLLGHKDISEVQMFQCKMCEFQTRHRGSLKIHLLTHKDISEVELFKCEKCQFQTRYNRSLKSHLLSHKDISEVPVFKCDMCEYQTKYKKNLKTHFLVHKDISKVQIFKCEICEYQTKYRGNLKSHLLSHKDA